MKNLLLAVLFAFLTMACQTDKNNYILKGTAPTAKDGSKVYLYEDVFRKIAKDSTIVKGGEFTFEGNIDKPMARILIVEGLGIDQKDIAEGVRIDDIASVSSLLVIEPNKTIEVAVNEKGFLKVSNSELTDKHITFFNNLSQSGSSDSERLINFIKENKDNAIGIHYFTNSIGLIPMSTENLKELYPLFTDKRLENERVADMLTYIENLDKTAAIGTKYIDLTGKNTEGTEISLSDYIGKNKVVLLYFWNYRYPVNEISELTDIYKKHHAKGFEIIGIHTGINEILWKEEITKNELTWPQMWNSGSSVDVFKSYAIFDTPVAILVDEDGIIISREISNSDLSHELSKLLKSL